MFQFKDLNGDSAEKKKKWPLWPRNLINDLSFYWFFFFVLFPSTSDILKKAKQLHDLLHIEVMKLERAFVAAFRRISCNADNIKYRQGANIRQFTWSQWKCTRAYFTFFLESNHRKGEQDQAQDQPHDPLISAHTKTRWTLATLFKAEDFTLFCRLAFQNHFPTRVEKDRKDSWPIFRLLLACLHIHMQLF